MGTTFAGVLSNPVVAFVLRAALGAYIVWMARGFYADPLAYFRRWMPRLKEVPWMRAMIRGAAAFCIWGGCFIVLAAVAVQLLNLHGITLAIVLVILATVVTYFLLPGNAGPSAASSRGDDSMPPLK